MARGHSRGRSERVLVAEDNYVTAPAIGRPYVAERQVEYWSSRQVEDFFWDLGYECLSFPISQKAEQLIPPDFIFQPNDTLKLFGLQSNFLYRVNPDYCHIHPTQLF